jgi:hypothetical protein
MPGKQAKVVTRAMLRRMLRHASKSPFPARNRAMILLSVKAGLRACEIARLEWSMILDARGRAADVISVRDASEEAFGPEDPGPPCPTARADGAIESQRSRWTGHSHVSGSPDAPDKHRQLVCEPLPRARL